MLYISGSSGAQFDERTSQMRGADNIMKAIFASHAATLHRQFEDTRTDTRMSQSVSKKS